MLVAKKIRLKPTKKQEELFRKSSGTARWAYNQYLAKNNELYSAYLKDNTLSKSISEQSFRKYINNELKPSTHQWLKEVSSNVMKQAVKDADLSRKRWFKGIAKKPKFKSKHDLNQGFYVNYESLKRMPNGFKGEKIGYIKTCEQLPKLKKREKYSNPRISFDGLYWYLSVGYNKAEENTEEYTKAIGIDLGLKDLAIVGNEDGYKKYKNINKSKRVKKLEKRLIREQRKLSKKREKNKRDKNKDLQECKNYQKQKKEVLKLYRKLNNIRTNYIHQITAEIVKAKPSKIVMEDLNISGMMKNKHLAKSISNQKWYEFKRQIEYKSKLNNIEFKQADRFYASSKICSCCGNKKNNLKLSDRIYKCLSCGAEIDRDYNAGINLSKL